MDIPVSRLNQRMALQLPAEFPLGLVFVVGKVAKLKAGTTVTEGADGFHLVDSKFCLRCRLSERATREVVLREGDMIRAGGHLAFEPTEAGYYLIARDVEVLQEYRPVRSTLSEIAAISSGSAAATELAPADLPDWVKKLAPPEVQDELAATVPLSTVGVASELPVDSTAHEGTENAWEQIASVGESMAYPAEDPVLAGLTDELIAFLSEAMDRPEDVEVTPQLIAELSPADQPASSILEGDRPELSGFEDPSVPAVGGVRSENDAGEHAAPVPANLSELPATGPQPSAAMAEPEAEPRQAQNGLEFAQSREPSPAHNPSKAPVRRASLQKNEIPLHTVALLMIFLAVFVAVILLLAIFISLT